MTSEPSSVTSDAGGAEFRTDTVTAAEIVSWPAASRAIAVSTCRLFVAAAVSQLTEYGAVESARPRSAPSSWNWTLVTPTSSLARADTLTAPVTVASAAGASIDTDGAVVSGAGGVAGVTAR